MHPTSRKPLGNISQNRIRGVEPKRMVETKIGQEKLPLFQSSVIFIKNSKEQIQPKSAQGSSSITVKQSSVNHTPSTKELSIGEVTLKEIEEAILKVKGEAILKKFQTNENGLKEEFFADKSIHQPYLDYIRDEKAHQTHLNFILQETQQANEARIKAQEEAKIHREARIKAEEKLKLNEDARIKNLKKSSSLKNR